MTSVDDGTCTLIDNLKHRLESLVRELDNMVSTERSAKESQDFQHEFNLFKTDQDLVKNKLQELEIVLGDSGKEVGSKIQELSYSVDELERKMNEIKVWYEESHMEKAISELKEPTKSVENCADQVHSHDSECTGSELERTGSELEFLFSMIDKHAEDIALEKLRMTAGVDAKELKNADEDHVNDQSNNKDCSGFESDSNTGSNKRMETTSLSAEANRGNRISLGDRFKEATGFSEDDALSNADEDCVNDSNQGALNVAGTSLESESASYPLLRIFFRFCVWFKPLLSVFFRWFKNQMKKLKTMLKKRG